MPATTPHQTLLDQLGWRYATKKFDPARKIPSDLWATLEKAAVLAPSSYGYEPWRFVVVTTPALREKLKPAAYNQAQVTDASHLIVFCRRESITPEDTEALLARTAKARGVSVESLSAFRGVLSGFVAGGKPPGGEWTVYTARQTYIALGFFLSAAAALGIDACPMEGFDPIQFDEILGLKGSGYLSTVMATAGYRAADDKYATHHKVRRSLEDVIVRR